MGAVPFFAPPVFPDDEAMTRQARVLFVLLATDCVVIGAGALATIPVVANKTGFSLVLGVLLARLLLSRALARRGQVRQASWLWIGGMWLVTNLMVALTGRLGTTLVALPLAIAVLAGILLGRRPAIALSILSCLALLAMALLESAGAPLVAVFPAPPLAQWVALCMAFAFALVPLLLTLHSLDTALARTRKSEQRYATLFEAAPVMALILREHGSIPRIAACNETFLHTLGYRRDQVLGQPLLAFYPVPAATALVETQAPQLQAPLQLAVERELVTSDGRLLPTLLQVAPERNALGQVTGILLMYLDMTARKQAERGVRRLSRTYRVLSAVNAAIIHTRNPQDLFETACRIAVEHGGFRMAWIGLVDPQTRRVRPVASAGVTAQYLEQLNIDLDDPVRGHGPTATAVRTGVRQVVNDIANDPQMAPWQANALALGYQSSAGFPLIVAGAVVGVLNLYAPEPDCFDVVEVRLYDEMALDIAFALEGLARDEQRLQLERAQQKRLAELTCLRQVQRLVERDLTLDDLGPQVVEALAAALQHPDLVVAQLQLAGQRYGADGAALPPEQRLAAPIRLGDDYAGLLTVGYREARPFILPEEQSLIDGIAHSLGRWVERRQAAQALQSERNALADRVERRTAELSRTNAELARAVRAKDEFLAMMSHELRSPLNAILGYSESLQEAIYDPLTERQQRAIHHIETSGQHLLALITDILDLSKIEAGRLDLQREAVSVAEVCQASLLFVRELAAKQRLRLDFTLDDHISRMSVDPRRLKQILVNLLSNAVKFTEAGGWVRLEVAADEAAGVITFAVQDSGIGIAPEDMPRLFQPFTQIDSRLSRQHSGTGLGLSLVRRLVELHGGSVAVASTPGVGSRFTVALPYTPVASGSAAAPDAGAAGLRSALAIEDSAVVREQLTRYLGEINIHATTLPDGAGALDAIGALRPDVIILDVLMPGESGWTLLSRLKADAALRAIPVIMVSIVDERARGMAAGATAYLVKPVTREALRQALEISAASGDPPREPAREAAIITPAAHSGAERASILLAEDNDVNIEVIGDVLQAQGYRVIVARNGREALSLASALRPSLILMDVQMPEMDGIEATRQIRTLEALATTPIIALTALAMPGDRERCLAAGANEYLTKPVSLRRLVETMQRLMDSVGEAPRPAPDHPAA